MMTGAKSYMQQQGGKGCMAKWRYDHDGPTSGSMEVTTPSLPGQLLVLRISVLFCILLLPKAAKAAQALLTAPLQQQPPPDLDPPTFSRSGSISPSATAGPPLSYLLSSYDYYGPPYSGSTLADSTLPSTPLSTPLPVSSASGPSSSSSSTSPGQQETDPSCLVLVSYGANAGNINQVGLVRCIHPSLMMTPLPLILTCCPLTDD